MPWYYYLLYFLAGAFLANGIPHFVQGVCGNKFQSPFASPPGKGESSAVVNVAWGWLNLVVGFGLIGYFFPPLPPPFGLFGAAMLGAIALGLAMAHHFGKVRNAPPHP
jgi:hypothetical protein